MDNKNTRFEIRVLNEWESINPIDIKDGMTFRMYEKDGYPVTYKGEYYWVADGDAFYNDDGNVTINCKE